MEKKIPYRYCIVPSCTNTTFSTPEKYFFHVPNDKKLRNKWCKLMKREKVLSPKTSRHCCEDHFDVEKDTENFMKYRLVGGTLKLKGNVCPHKFDCQKAVKPQKERVAYETADNTHSSPTTSLTMSTKQKILEDVHPLTIIREVQKWPVLYTRDARDRGNKAFKFRVWREVTETLFDDWNTFDDKEKDSKVNEVMRRWRNLRDTFKRQLETDKKVKEGLEPKKKQYIYFKDMEFLLPHMTLEEESPASAERSSPEGPSKRRLEQHLPEEVLVPVCAPKAQQFTCVHEEIDEDRHFVLSLIPTLKKLPDEDKLTTKMEILKVLRDASKSSSHNSNGQVMFADENVTDTLKYEYMEDDESTND